MVGKSCLLKSYLWANNHIMFNNYRKLNEKFQENEDCNMPFNGFGWSIFEFQWVCMHMHTHTYTDNSVSHFVLKMMHNLFITFEVTYVNLFSWTLNLVSEIDKLDIFVFILLIKKITKVQKAYPKLPSYQVVKYECRLCYKPSRIYKREYNVDISMNQNPYKQHLRYDIDKTHLDPSSIILSWH